MRLIKRKSKLQASPRTLTEYMYLTGITTQRELADKLGISESYISRYFSGQQRFGYDTAVVISRITRVPVENLMKAGE